MADKLLNMVFPHLTTDQRDAVVAAVESRIQAGRMLQGLPPQFLVFWEARLFEPPEAGAQHDWSSQTSRAALFHLSNNYSPNWQGFPLLARVLPEAEWKKIQRASQLQAQRRFLREQEYAQPTQRKRLLRIVLGILLPATLILIGIFLKILNTTPGLS
jgi:hypothetical protein